MVAWSLAGRMMARFAFIAVLMVVLGGVGFGLDWQSAPMSPMPESGRTTPVAVVPATPLAPIGGPGLLAPATISQPAMPATDTTTQVTCNVSACARAYRSFQASDCSYQPRGGPRRRCSK